MAGSTEVCAQEVLEVVPLVMRVIRTEMRVHRTDLSVPQWRTLAFIRNHAGTSLSALAEHIGLALPSMSKLVEGLVQRQLVTREIARHDRRCITLGLTEAGVAEMRAARGATQAFLARQLGSLTESERLTITQAMELLRPVFTPGVEPQNNRNQAETLGSK